MKIFIPYYIAILLIMSCDDASLNIECEEATIYSIFIDEMTIPPPPPPKDGSTPKPLNIDSLNKVKVEVVVDTILFQTSKSVYIDKEFLEYQMLVDNISSLSAKAVNTAFIRSDKGHTLVLGNSLEDSEAKYSQMLRISRIAFNEDKNKAALYAGHSTHPLASYLNLYLLKKINGKWKIIYKKNVEVS